MKNIILSNFETVLSLEAYLLEINPKLNNDEKEKIKSILKNLSSIIIAFDFKFKGPIKSVVDKRFSYEQLLYLCYVKINESKLPAHENHMFKNSSYSSTIFSKNVISLPAQEIERKLLSTDNLSLGYFLNKNQSYDAVHWRQFYEIVGFSIFKLLIIHSSMFRQLKNSKQKNYIQICGTRFNFAYKSLVSEKLKIDEKQIEEKLKSKKTRNRRKFLLSKFRKKLFF